jgi:hypothetical protein
MRTVVSIIVLATVMLHPALARSDSKETGKWGQVGGWQVRVDPSLGHGCFAMQIYEDGTVIRVGFNISNRTIYFTLGNTAWRSLEVGKIYRMRSVFDDQKSYDGELTGRQIGGDGMVFLDHSSVSYEFTHDFMARSGMRIYFRGNQILRNTYAALSEVVNCQREMNSAGGNVGSQQPAADPFAGPSRDPFSR